MNRRQWFQSATLAAGAALVAGPVFAKDETKTKSAMTLWQLPNQTRTQMMSYLCRTADGKLIAIDGGMPGDADYLVKTIHEVGGGHVDAWLFSHMHFDHVGALATILDRGGCGLAIDHIYHEFPTADWVAQYENGSSNNYAFTRKGLKNFKNQSALPPGKPIRFGDVEISALNDFDPSIHNNAINNSCIVYRFKTPKTTILFLGDLGVEAGLRVSKLVPPETLKADIVQMAHHGQQGVAREFYELVKPRICLWPTPDWLWDNNSGKGDGSGPWKTVQNRAWMDDLGVKTHYVMKNGLTKLEIE